MYVHMYVCIYWYISFFGTAAVPPLLVGTLLGGYYGAKTLTTVPEAPLKALFGGFVGVLGAKQVLGAFRNVKKIK